MMICKIYSALHAGTFTVYYAARKAPSGPLCIGVATSAQATGAYRRVRLFRHPGDLVSYTFFMPELRISTVCRDDPNVHPPLYTFAI
jgi:hypothetical protein